MSIDKLRLKKRESGRATLFQRSGETGKVRGLSITAGVINRNWLEKVKRSVYF
ncbi:MULTISPECIES: hypothetical protein [Pantoea]|uniref:hypothetical protein n=1 Tax=Pantoea TaxID=53335 RepID=UPI00167FE97B|nr:MULTISPECIES: hypothetical protein [Pantoea]